MQDVGSAQRSFFPGGDPGDNVPETVWPLLIDIAQILKKYHLQAAVWLSTWQLNNKLAPFPLFSTHFYFSSMRFNNIITQAQTQSCSLTCWFCGKEWLKDFVNYFLRNAATIICNR